MTPITFDETYASVPQEQREALKTFREAHPPQTVTVNNTDWTYLTAGNRLQPPLLWLVGGLKAADAAHTYIPHLSDDFYVIAPDYPALDNMGDLAQGLAGILDAEDIDKAGVLAGSFGGMLAQVFVREYPQRVTHLVLSTTSAPDEGRAEQYQRQLEMIAGADEATLRDAAEMQFYGIIDPPETHEAFYKAYLHELFHERLTPDDITSTFEALIDFLQRDYAADDLDEWAGKILILDSSDDATFGEATRQTMYSLYPQAERYNFEEGGHSPASAQPDVYFGIVRDFLTDRR